MPAMDRLERGRSRGGCAPSPHPPTCTPALESAVHLKLGARSSHAWSRGPAVTLRVMIPRGEPGGRSSQVLCPEPPAPTPQPAGTWGLTPEASRHWQHFFRLAQTLPRASQVWAPGLALASSGRGGGTVKSQGPILRGCHGGRAGPGIRKRPSPGRPRCTLHLPALASCFDSPRNQRRASSLCAGGCSWRGQPRGCARGRREDPSHGGRCPPGL